MRKPLMVMWRSYLTVAFKNSRKNLENVLRCGGLFEMIGKVPGKKLTVAYRDSGLMLEKDIFVSIKLSKYNKLSATHILIKRLG